MTSADRPFLLSCHGILAENSCLDSATLIELKFHHAVHALKWENHTDTAINIRSHEQNVKEKFPYDDEIFGAKLNIPRTHVHIHTHTIDLKKINQNSACNDSDVMVASARGSNYSKKNQQQN